MRTDQRIRASDRRSAARRCSRTCDFNAVKAWKAAAPGRKAIGYMPIYVPRELIHAAGMLPVGILGGGDQLEVIQGDAYYQSYICRIPRSTLELGLTGRLDCLDGMLFPSICDVIRNLSGMWQILFKDKYVQVLRRAAELRRRDRRRVLRPRDADAARGPRQARAASRSPTTRCAPRSPSTTTTAAPCASSTPTARRSPGRRRPPRCTWCCARAWCCRPRSTRRSCASYIAATDAESGRKRDNARVVLTGSFCEQPPLGLIKSIEMAGCYVVDDDFMLVHALAAGRRADDRRSAARSSPRRSCTARPRPPRSTTTKREDKGQFLLQQVQDARRRRRDLRRALVLRPGAARAADAAGRARPSTRSPTPRSSTRRTPARWRRSASRPAPSPIRSSCGAPHERRPPMSTPIQMMPPQRAEEARSAGPERRRDVLQKEMINRNYHELATAHDQGRKICRDLRAGQPERAADVLRLRAQPPGDQRAAERHAQEVRQDDHGRRARRALRGRLHLRQGRPRHDAEGDIGPTGEPLPTPGHAAALLHRLLHLHEVVRADPPEVRLRDA